MSECTPYLRNFVKKLPILVKQNDGLQKNNVWAITL